MSIGISVRIGEKVITITDILKAAKKIGYQYDEFTNVGNVSVIKFESVGIIVYFTPEIKGTGNEYDSNLLNNEFVTRQIIEFKFIDFFNDIDRRYQWVYGIISKLVTKKNMKALVLVNYDTEVMVLYDNRILLNAEYVWIKEYIDCITDVKEIVEKTIN